MVDDITSCLAVLASICLNGNATADVYYGAPISGATIRYGGATIESLTGSDLILPPYVPDMRRQCSARACLFYRGHCAEAGAQRTCTLWYSFSREMELRKVTVAGDRAAVSLAMGDLRLVRSPNVLFPLSTFRYDAPDDLPPLCRVRPVSGSRTGRLERRCD